MTDFLLLFYLLLVVVGFLIFLVAVVEMNDHRKRDIARLRRELAELRRDTFKHIHRQ
ncbi:MAG: hypothetical protein IAE97_06625 [Chthoniobacterales bacterium]|nr:hypothetical protein [Chthoniobacterales bacterium]